MFCTSVDLLTYKNICDGQKNDCIEKAKRKCELDLTCKGFMFDINWLQNNKGVQTCTVETIRYENGKQDWFTYLKTIAVITPSKDEIIKGQKRENLS